jgi:hypothetical protein
VFCCRPDRSAVIWQLTLPQDHGPELLKVLGVSTPTTRGQEAQLDQVVEAHWIAREGRIDNASGKEDNDQDHVNFRVSTYLGLIG